MTNLEWQHEGKIIEITKEGGFKVPGLEISGSDFSTLEAAKEAIHKSGVGERASIKLDMEVVTVLRVGYGKPEPRELSKVTIRRIHSGTGKWLTTPEKVGGLVFRDSSKVRDLHKRYWAARTTVTEIEADLDNVGFALPSLSTRGDQSATYERGIKEIKEWYSNQEGE